MNKKFILIIGSALLICALMMTSGLFIGTVMASDSTDRDLFKSTTVSGVDVLSPGGAFYNVVDMTADDTDKYLTLPSVSGHDGEMLMYKRFGGSSSHMLMISPANTGELEGGALSDLVLTNPTDYAILVADETNGTWWLMARGNF